MSKGQTRTITLETRYGVHLDYVIFPIDIRELRHALAKYGYELSHTEGIPPPPTRISFSGDVARKAETRVILDSDNSELAIVGRSLNDVKVSFEELAKVVDTELGVSLEERVKFYWCIAHYKISTGRTPRTEIAKADNKDYIARFSQVLGEEISSFSIRISPKDAVPNQESWFDIAIEPDIANEKFYHVGLVFRSPDKGKTETFVRDLENNLLKLLKVIEG